VNQLYKCIILMKKNIKQVSGNYVMRMSCVCLVFELKSVSTYFSVLSC